MATDYLTTGPTHPLLIHGDACHLPLADQSAHSVITSCPYYGLRSYQGVEPSLWPGGSYAPVPGAPPIVIPGPTIEEMAACVHEWGEGTRGRKRGHPGDKSTLVGTQTAMLSKEAVSTGATCLRCGCYRGTLGNENTPHRFIWHCLLWLREVRRCLRDDGVCWVIIGDSFFGDSPVRQKSAEAFSPTWDPAQTASRGGLRRSAAQQDGLKPGALLGIPGRLHQAALADGWIVRNDVIFAKASPMPESVAGWRFQQARCGCVQPHERRAISYHPPGAGAQVNFGMNFRGDLSPQPDPACPQCGGTGRLAEEALRQGSWRHTRAHEAILMMTKGMQYFSNSEAVREEAVMTPQRRTKGHSLCTYDPPGRQAPSRGDRGVKDTPGVDGPGGRNPRSVVTPRSSSLNLQHYAAFPPDLLVPLIKATCPERVCPQCGQGWAPVITSEGGRDWHSDRMKDNGYPGALNGAGGYKRGQSHEPLNNTQRHTTHGLAPTCAHYCTCATAPCLCGKLPLAAYMPGVVLDPFAGSSTTLLVARELRRRALGVELSATYLDLSRERLGFVDLAAWEHGAAPTVETFDDLPLFQEGPDAHP